MRNLHLKHTSQATRLLALSALLLMLLAFPTGRAVAAAPDTGPDQLSLFSLQTTQADATDPSAPMRIQTEVGYTLSSVPTGFIALFTFEDSSNQASGQSPPIPVQSGSGKISLDVDYPLTAKAQAVSLLIGMFTDDKRLIGWLATNPIPVSSLAGRLEFQQAMAARQDGDGKLAVERLGKAISLSPDVGSLYYWRADTLLRMSQFDEAIADYSTALQLMPDHAASMVGRGIAFVWKGNWQAGADDLTSALSIVQDPSPLTAWAHRARGVAYSAMGRYAEAVADYRDYLAQSPGAPDQDQVQEWIDRLGAS